MTPDSPRAASFRLFARTSALLVVAGAVAVMVGWFLDIALLKSIVLGLPTMKINTACGLFAAAVSLWLLVVAAPGSWQCLLARALAGFTAVLAGLNLAEDIFGLNLGIDQLIVHDGGGSKYPGRMSSATALNLLLLGMALMSLKARRPSIAACSHWLVLPPLLLSTLAYGVEYQIGIFASMALHTALAIYILALAMLAADMRQGFALIAAGDTAAGVISRWLLPVIPLLLFVLGWLRHRGELAGLYDFRSGLAVMVIASIAVCAVAVAWITNILHKTDIDRRAAETEIVNLNAALQLRKSEERFRILVRGVKDYAILMLDREGFVVSWNEGAERIKGYKADEIIGRHFSVFYTPEDRAKARPEAELLQAVSEGKFEDQGWRLRKDNSGFWANVLVTPLHDENGELSGFSTITRDITERKAAEAMIVRQMEELSRSNDELQQFANIASHDLQEPLRAVTQYVQLLSRRYKGRLDTDADEFIAFAVAGTTRMQQLIKDLLAYSRVGARSKPLADTSSEDALNQAIINLRGSIEASGALVTHDPLPIVTADNSQLVQLFQNLVGNGIKYHKSGIPQIHIAAAMNGDRKWNFSVRDNGIGIEPKNFDRIFGMFQRLHNREEFAGTGIGLAICKKIVERHGGSISVESQPGKGSTFRFAMAEATTSARTG